MRVAVILNENELQRYGHPNVIPFLQSLFENDTLKYAFFPFTNVNIDFLFSGGEKQLLNYDSLYISTNACNDSDILKKLVENRAMIESFIKSGHGIFVGYQKKISISNDPNACFLPEIYNYDVVRKEKEYEQWMRENDSETLREQGIPIFEKSSNTGHVNIHEANKNDVILNYPRKISASDIETKCKDETNGFRAHVYRAVIRPKHLGAYDVLLCDNSYEYSRPLLCKCVSGKAERIVITSIALDWERHTDILYNVIKYITEGTPHIALVTDIAKTDGDFKYLMSSMSMHKISHCVLSPKWLYGALNENNDYLKNQIRIYVFSSCFPRTVIDQFWNLYKSLIDIKVYYFEKKQGDGDQILMEYSNISSIETMIKNVTLWINSHYSGGMFKGSFWTTFDTLLMLKKMGFQYKSFLQGIFKDIFDNHYFKDGDGSYDGLIGCTVGLLELMVVLKDDVREYYPQIDEYIEKTREWVLNKAEKVSQYEQLSIVLALYRLGLIHSLDKVNHVKIDSLCTRNVEVWTTANDNLENDLCRYIEFCLYRSQNGSLSELVKHLLDLQDEYGTWTSVGRTANTLNFLIENHKKLIELLSEEDGERLNSCIELGIIYLSEEYDEKSSCWGNDFLSTVKASLALGSYNKNFKYATKDFSETIRGQATQLSSSELASYAIETISKQRTQINELNESYEAKIKALKADRDNLFEKQTENAVTIQNYETEIEFKNSRMKTYGKIVITLSTICAFLAILIGIKYRAYADVFQKIISFFDLNDIITNTASSIVLLAVGGVGTYLVLKFVKQKPAKKKEKAKKLSFKLNNKNKK